MRTIFIYDGEWVLITALGIAVLIAMVLLLKGGGNDKGVTDKKKHPQRTPTGNKDEDKLIELSKELNRFRQNRDKKRPIVSYHGGCFGCTMQHKHGLSVCSGCQYMDANWDLPNLNDSDQREAEIKEKIRKVAEKRFEEKFMIVGLADNTTGIIKRKDD